MLSIGQGARTFGSVSCLIMWVGSMGCLPSLGPGGDHGSGCGAAPCDGNACVWVRPAARNSRVVVFMMEMVVLES